MSFAAKNWYAEYTLIIQKTGLNTIALNPYKNNFLFFALEQSIFFNSPGFVFVVIYKDISDLLKRYVEMYKNQKQRVLGMI